MTASNWPECIDFTLAFEGGYDNTPKDRGNWTSGTIGAGELKGTKYGIAAHVYPGLDIRNLTKADAIAIYRRDYWPKVAGDQQPDGVDLIAWDICVNSGASRALKIQAASLGVDLATARTLADQATRETDKVLLVKTMCAKRAAFYRALSTFDTFGKGWLRRNAAAEAKGVTMALRATKAPPAEIKQKLDEEAKGAAKTTKANAGGAAGTAAGGASTTQTPVDWTWDWWTLGKVGLVIVCLGALVYFGRKALQHNERAKAYAEAVKAIIGG
jgi:lysozyme family protein